MQTKILGTSNQGAIAPAEQAVDPTFLAARVALRPLDYAGVGRVLGHYRAGFSTSAAAFTANAVLANMRWTDTGSYFVLIRLLAGVTVVTAVTAQRQDPIAASIVRGYTASETTSLTNVTISGNNQKARANMGSSLVAQLAVASAAAGITGGTGTNDANPFGLATLAPALVGLGTGVNMQELYVADTLYGHPPVFTGNEGFRMTWGGTTLATGTVTVNMVAAWAEVVVF